MRPKGAHGVSPLVKFVLYVDSAGMWRVQAVTAEGTAFTNRLGLREPWRGLRDDALVAACGIAGAKFVHAAGFIGGHATFEVRPLGSIPDVERRAAAAAVGQLPALRVVTARAPHPCACAAVARPHPVGRSRDGRPDGSLDSRVARCLDGRAACHPHGRPNGQTAAMPAPPRRCFQARRLGWPSRQPFGQPSTGRSSCREPRQPSSRPPCRSSRRPSGQASGRPSSRPPRKPS